MPTQTANSPKATARIVLFGSEGGFSRAVLEQLLQNKVSVLAIVMPGVTPQEQPTTHAPIIFEQPPDISSLAGLAETRQIPIIRSLDCNEQTLIDQLTGLDVDLFLVACFPLKLPLATYEMPGTPCWNLHPSLLPTYRGPDPMYWQLKNNERNTGLTLHEVTETIDAGKIVAQQPVALPADNSAASLNSWVAKNGTDLFIQAFQQYLAGNLEPRPQEEAHASYFPFRD